MTLIKDKVTGEWKKVCEDYAFSWGFPGLVQQFAGASSKIPPHWLLCDGSEYDVGAYPELFDVIGYTYGGSGSRFKVPDYRECTLVGAGQNRTDTIKAHDVYDLGKFKDDQLQNITGAFRPGTYTYMDGIYNGAIYNAASPYSASKYYGSNNGTTTNSLGFDASRVVRAGLVTHGKQKGVNYIIHV